MMKRLREVSKVEKIYDEFYQHLCKKYDPEFVERYLVVEDNYLQEESSESESTDSDETVLVVHELGSDSDSE